MLEHSSPPPYTRSWLMVVHDMQVRAAESEMIPSELARHHEDIPDHLHALVVVVPAQLQLAQEGLPLRGLYLGGHHPQVLSLRLHQAVVEAVPELVDHHVVGIPAPQQQQTV